uniref:UPF0215 protein ENO77_00620 n=1 Tax=Ignisphaera aggregans TaxID=334771 RepID=A0A7C2ZNH9_9CREN
MTHTLDGCFLGIDDGYFDIAYKKARLGHRTVLAGAVVCNNAFENLFLDVVTVDGLDALSVASRIVEKTVALHDIKAVFLDGVTYAGFNIIDPDRLYAISSIPIVVVFRHKLELEKVREALVNHFHDYKYRYGVIKKTYARSFELHLTHIPTTIRVYAVGLNSDRVGKLLLKLCGIFADPLPLRIADKIASALGKIYVGQYFKEKRNEIN